jgi:hypothetical protein
MEHGPTTTSKRGSLPCRISLICLRLEKMSREASSETGHFFHTDDADVVGKMLHAGGVAVLGNRLISVQCQGNRWLAWRACW